MEAESTKPVEELSPEEAQAEIKKSFGNLKKLLKVKSKSELIEIIWTYGIQLQEMQRVAQMLFEENKELKGTSND